MNGRPLTEEQMQKIHDANPLPAPKRHRMTRVKRGEFFCPGCGITIKRSKQ